MDMQNAHDKRDNEAEAAGISGGGAMFDAAAQWLRQHRQPKQLMLGIAGLLGRIEQLKADLSAATATPKGRGR